jgi:hypothetical protein
VESCTSHITKFGYTSTAALPVAVNQVDHFFPATMTDSAIIYFGQFLRLLWAIFFGRLLWAITLGDYFGRFSVCWPII